MVDGEGEASARDRTRAAAIEAVDAIAHAVSDENDTVEVAEGKFELIGLADAAQAAVADLLAEFDIQCTLDDKAPVDIKERPLGDNGNLILRCEHAPPHCWLRDGTRIACPKPR